MANKWNDGDCFRVGEVWASPRGSLWRVMSYAPMPPGYRRHVVLRLGADGGGRKKLREWDAVQDWVRQQNTSPSGGEKA